MLLLPKCLFYVFNLDLHYYPTLDFLLCFDFSIWTPHHHHLPVHGWSIIPKDLGLTPMFLYMLLSSPELIFLSRRKNKSLYLHRLSIGNKYWRWWCFWWYWCLFWCWRWWRWQKKQRKEYNNLKWYHGRAAKIIMV